MDFQLTLNNKRLKQESSIKYLRIFMLQKKAVRLIAFSSFDAHSSPLFKKLSILKMNDLVEYYVAIFMFKYNNNLLPPVFKKFFVSVSNIHKYQTRSATKENFYIPKSKTNWKI